MPFRNDIADTPYTSFWLVCRAVDLFARRSDDAGHHEADDSFNLSSEKSWRDLEELEELEGRDPEDEAGAASEAQRHSVVVFVAYENTEIQGRRQNRFKLGEVHENMVTNYAVDITALAYKLSLVTFF